LTWSTSACICSADNSRGLFDPPRRTRFGQSFRERGNRPARSIDRSHAELRGVFRQAFVLECFNESFQKMGKLALVIFMCGRYRPRPPFKNSIMPAPDSIHDAVKNALLKDGWVITADPHWIQYDDLNLFADLSAERTIVMDPEREEIIQWIS
jgi:hypothetical protein